VTPREFREGIRRHKSGITEWLFETPEESTALEIITIFANTGTFLVVAIAAGGLAERFRSTQEELETKQADLRDLEAFTNLIFDSVGTGLIALDRGHRVTAVNRAAEQITGMAADAALGQPWSVFGGGVPLAVIESEIASSVRGSAWREVTLRRGDGNSLARPDGRPLPWRPPPIPCRRVNPQYARWRASALARFPRA